MSRFEKNPKFFQIRDFGKIENCNCCNLVVQRLRTAKRTPETCFSHYFAKVYIFGFLSETYILTYLQLFKMMDAFAEAFVCLVSKCSCTGVSESNPRFSSSDVLYGQAHGYFARIELILQPDGLYYLKKRFPVLQINRSRFAMKIFRFSFFSLCFSLHFLTGRSCALT